MNKISFRQVLDRYQENNLAYGLLPLQNDMTAVISGRGGHILGPFLSEDGERITWTHPAFATRAGFQEFLALDSWNVGGDRIWIGPEIQFGTSDRTDFWGTVHAPSRLDPGQYRLDQPRGDQWRLSQDVTLTAYNLASGQKQLHLERLIRRVEDPLRHLADHTRLMAGVRFAGYEQMVSLSEAQHDHIMSETWSVVQLNPGGVLLIPASPRLEYSDYFDPIDEEHQTLHPDHARIKISGRRRFKVGYKAAHVFGRLAYFNHLDGGRAYLIVRNFFNNPSAPYIDEPPDRPGCHGHSIHVYNDDGSFGGFGELECNGQTIGGHTGRSSSNDQMVLWFYVGPSEAVTRLVPHLLGIEL
jgi:hypothetical protein